MKAVFADTSPYIGMPMRRKRRVELMIAVLATVGLAATADLGWESMRVETTRCGAAGSCVEVAAGQRLYIRTTGPRTGAHVVLEAGLGATVPNWERTRALLQNEFRVTAYDRAGTGGSDVADKADAIAQADRLDKLLAKIAPDEQVVLVAHSIGGLYARVFAARYRERLAGLVLVDPMNPDDMQRLPATDIAANNALFRKLRFGAWLGQLRLLRFFPLFDDFGSGLSEDDAAYVRATMHDRRHLQGVAQEIEAYPTSAKQAGSVKLPADLPLIVLSATVPDDEGTRIFQQLHAETALESHVGRHIRVPASTHVGLITDPNQLSALNAAVQDLSLQRSMARN